ncbi:hypothetical protein [Flavobacterium sp. GP15]|nr:hypothetical protein [Flavobacterium sp. GP15]
MQTLKNVVAPFSMFIKNYSISKTGRNEYLIPSFAILGNSKK